MPPLTLARSMRNGSRRGQAAVAFVVFMALMLLLTAVTMNLGEAARLKTATANAADAGALAGASWVSSGQNQMAVVAEAMWANIITAQIFLAVPFCRTLDASGGSKESGLPSIVPSGWGKGALAVVSLGITLSALNEWLASTANDVMEQAWQIAKADALFQTIGNLAIDDEGNSPARVEIRRLQDQLQTSRTVPASVRLEWTRSGSPATAQPSWAKIDLEFPSHLLMPRMTLGKKRLWAFVLSPPILWCSWPAFGRNQFSLWQLTLPIAAAVAKTAPWRPGKYLGAGWTTYTQIFQSNLRVHKGIGKCHGTPYFDTEFCFPIPLPFKVLKPGEIQFGGPGPEIKVTVTQHREGRTALAFWKVRYPDQVVSTASANYSAAKVSFAPKKSSLAQLVKVQ